MAKKKRFTPLTPEGRSVSFRLKKDCPIEIFDQLNEVHRDSDTGLSEYFTGLLLQDLGFQQRKYINSEKINETIENLVQEKLKSLQDNGPSIDALLDEIRTLKEQNFQLQSKLFNLIDNKPSFIASNNSINNNVDGDSANIPVPTEVINMEQNHEHKKEISEIKPDTISMDLDRTEIKHMHTDDNIIKPVNSPLTLKNSINPYEGVAKRLAGQNSNTNNNLSINDTTKQDDPPAPKTRSRSGKWNF